MQPAVITGQLLPDFSLVPHAYGWSGTFPGTPATLFGRPIGLEIHTRPLPEDGPPPPVSPSQARLVARIQDCLKTLAPTIESAMLREHCDEAPDYPFRQMVESPHVWLDCGRDDGQSWTLVIGRSDNPEFGYHAEFRGDRFVEVWSGE